MTTDLSTTVVITPRDRYLGIEECIETLYEHTDQPFKLIVLDLAYPPALRRRIDQLLAGRVNAEVMELGLVIPMLALRKVRERIDTPFTVLLDNDSQVTAGWLEPLQRACKEQTPIVTPLILERDGLDQGAEIRNHLYTSDIRKVDVDGESFLIENKHFRRTEEAELPGELRETETFELHCVMFRTATLKQLDIPEMVVREHIDIAMQVIHQGGKIVVAPESRIVFDNLSTRMRLTDMRYFFFRWNEQLASASHRRFQQRWGYRFYSEQSMYNWAFRRKVYLVARFLYLPNGLANKLANGANRLRSHWDPLTDPIGKSEPLAHEGLTFSTGASESDSAAQGQRVA